MRNALTVDCPKCGAPETALCVKLNAGDGAEIQMNRVHKERAAIVGIPCGTSATAHATAR